MQTITFIHNKGLRFTVKSEFFQKWNIERVQEEDLMFLMNNMKMKEYLHNESGPAIIDLNYNTTQFWINGQKVDQATEEKFKFTESFNEEFRDFLK